MAKVPMDDQFVIGLAFREAIVIRYALHYWYMELDERIKSSPDPALRKEKDAVMKLDLRLRDAVEHAAMVAYGKTVSVTPGQVDEQEPQLALAEPSAAAT